jgi:pimeloyl-ACP methyl ester carboxylesterase
MTRRRALLVALLLAVIGLVVLVAWGAQPRPLPDLGPGSLAPALDGDSFVAQEIETDQALGVWRDATWRLHRNGPGRAPVVFVYVHGFGATRAEGEAVLDPLADRWGAHVLYVRLPGHGIDAEAHAAATPRQYARAVAHALQAAPLLGDKAVLVGSSTGGLLATWAAATLPSQVDALVLTSPLYAFHDPLAQQLLPRRAALPLVHLLYGEVRDAGWSSDPEGRKVEGYDERWLIQQKYSALIALEDLRRAIARPEVFGAVTAPTLLLHYFRDEAHQDTVVSVPAMRAAFDRFGAGAPHPASRMVAIEDGNHILTSAWVRTDKAAVTSAIEAFLHDTVGGPTGGDPKASDR